MVQSCCMRDHTYCSNVSKRQDLLPYTMSFGGYDYHKEKYIAVHSQHEGEVDNYITFRIKREVLDGLSVVSTVERTSLTQIEGSIRQLSIRSHVT
jgi:hypothetical protein